MSTPPSIEYLRRQLILTLPGSAAQELMTGRVRPMPDLIPADARVSSVLILFFMKEAELNLLFIRRTEDGRAHSGQISFPGGKQEIADMDLAATALREAHEEAGILPIDVDLLGALTPLYIPVSNFMVYAFVGYSSARPSYLLSEHEVAEILEIPVSWMMDEANKVTATVRPASSPEMALRVPAYCLPDGANIWGATAMIFSELEVIWKCRLPRSWPFCKQRLHLTLKQKHQGMKQSKFTESQIVAAIKQQEGGQSVKDISRGLGISEATFYNWKAKYGGMEISEVKRVKELEAELAQYKKMYAEVSFDLQALKNVVAKKW